MVGCDKGKGTQGKGKFDVHKLEDFLDRMLGRRPLVGCYWSSKRRGEARRLLKACTEGYNPNRSPKLEDLKPAQRKQAKQPKYRPVCKLASKKPAVLVKHIPGRIGKADPPMSVRRQPPISKVPAKRPVSDHASHCPRCQTAPCSAEPRRATRSRSTRSSPTQGRGGMSSKVAATRSRPSTTSSTRTRQRTMTKTSS